MKPQSAKSKGRRLQQQVVSDLLEVFAHLSEDDIRSTSMGAPGEDVVMSHAARMSIPFSFEAKNQERVNIWSSIAQAKANAPQNIDPVVVFKKNGETPHVAISWKTFLKLIHPQKENRENSKELHMLADALKKIASDMDK